MKIDGKAIAEELLIKLSDEVKALHKRGNTPTLAVIQIGDNPASTVYIRQKQKAAEKIGARIIVSNSITDLSIFNTDPSIHGVIIQRPVPDRAGEYHVIAKKDVDGFEPNSPFKVPVAMAVWKCIEFTGKKIRNVVVIGKGETAGAPIAHFLKEKDCTTSIIHSQTPDPTKIMKQADCIISCVGKERIVTADTVKPGAILIGVGLFRDEAGKLRGDYDEAEIEHIASYYTPTPGGVGPINISCLMQNLVTAAQTYRS